MKNKLTSILAAACVFGFLAIQVPVTALAESVVIGQVTATTTSTVDIVGVDKVDRTLSLKGPDGDTVMIKAGENWRNLEQIEIGDQLNAEFFESVSVSLGEKTQVPGESAEIIAARAADGEKPGAMIVEAVEIDTIIKAIDKDERILLLELPNGKEVTTQVDESIEAFDTLEEGDVIRTRYVQAAALQVEKKV